MRYEKGRKETTRQKIMEVASRQFKEQGVSAAGLSSIMTNAGLTNGAFYAHFDSKNDLLRESLDSAWEQLISQTETMADEAGLESVVRNYLSEAHRDHPGVGCPSSALLPEIGRQPEDVRKVYTDRLNAFVETVSKYLPDPGSQRSHSTARAMFGLAVGSLQLARAVNDPSLSRQILDDAVSAALTLSVSATSTR